MGVVCGLTYAYILKACDHIGIAADRGKQIHGEIERQDLLQSDIKLGNVLVNMYAKYGAIFRHASEHQQCGS